MQMDADDEGLPFFKPVGVPAAPPPPPADSSVANAEAAATVTADLEE